MRPRQNNFFRRVATRGPWGDPETVNGHLPVSLLVPQDLKSFLMLAQEAQATRLRLHYPV